MGVVQSHWEDNFENDDVVDDDGQNVDDDGNCCKSGTVEKIVDQLPSLSLLLLLFPSLDKCDNEKDGINCR